jgi:hypothetical protein
MNQRASRTCQNTSRLNQSVSRICQNTSWIFKNTSWICKRGDCNVSKSPSPLGRAGVGPARIRLQVKDLMKSVFFSEQVTGCCP